ncbi:MAG: hypothetical protein RL318_2939 [Fibrobacterota bacterium]|jgi:hypothetical protein
MKGLLATLPVFFLACQAQDHPAQVLNFPLLPPLATDSAAPREGAWSGIARDPSDPTGKTFWAVNDRGLNIPLDEPGKDGKGFPFPGYHQKLLRFRLDGTGIKILSLDSLATQESPARFTVGLPSTRFPTRETARRFDLRNGLPDTGILASSPDGFDFEGLRLTATHGYLCDEYGPSLIEFDRKAMRISRQWSPGDGLPAVLATRRPNHGFEGIALTPSGKIAGLMQSPLWNWIGKPRDTKDSRIVRLVVLDPKSGTVREFAVLSQERRKGRQVKMGDLVALDENRFLAIEHGKDTDGTESADLWILDITAATDVTSPAPQGRLFHRNKRTLEELMDADGLAKEGIQPVKKTLARGDLHKIPQWDMAKPEGLEVLDDTTAILVNDNDFGLGGTPSRLLILPVPSLRR